MLTDTTLKRLNTIGELSKQEKRINGVFRLMENEALWKQAYTNLRTNQGAITKGTGEDTLDGFSYKRIKTLIKELQSGNFEFKPVRRTYIPKKNGKKRALGIPSGNDKMVQEVMRIILEAIYEPVFCNNSHGFRPNRSCHTALIQVKETWTGVKWLIEMDIKGFFDNLNHDIMIQMLEQKIDDKRFIKLVKNLLKAGFVEEGIYKESYSGTMQGGNISPILSNIYLHELDSYMKEYIQKFNHGKGRASDKEYNRKSNDIYRLRKKYQKIKDQEGNNVELLREITKQIKAVQAEREKMPWGNPYDENYRRLMYNRYADDFIVGVIGSKREAKEIADNIIQFIENKLCIEIATEKFHIKHATQGVQYLGYDVHSYSGQKVLRNKINGKYTRSRTTKERVQLIIPEEKLWKYAKNRGYGDYYKNWTFSRPEILHGSDAEIIETYNAELRGLVNYYSIANSAKKTLNRVVSMGRSSCAKTLANKHKTSVTKTIKNMKKSNGEWVRTVEGDKEIHQFRVYRLKTDFKSVPIGYKGIDIPPNVIRFTYSRTELIAKMEAKVCEFCGASTEDVEVHHIRKLKDIQKGQEAWKVMMRARKRKTMVLCSKCHHKLHNGTL